MNQRPKALLENSGREAIFLHLLALSAYQPKPRTGRGRMFPNETRYDVLLREELRVRIPRRFGPFLVDLSKGRRSLEERQYSVRCDCGHGLWMVAEQILLHEQVDVGCLRQGCGLVPLDLLAWLDPEQALRRQHSDLLRLCPEEVDNAWGGTLMPDVPSADPGEGYQRFREDLRKLADPEAKLWWLCKSNPQLPLTADNVILLDRPTAFDLADGSKVCLGEVIHGSLPEQIFTQPTATDLGCRAQHPEGEVPMTATNILVISPRDPRYQQVTEVTGSSPKRPSRWFDYDALAEAYNEAEVGSFMVLPDSADMRMSNVTTVLENRGVRAHLDYRLHRPRRDSAGAVIEKDQRNLLVEKLSKRRIALKHELEHDS